MFYGVSHELLKRWDGLDSKSFFVVIIDFGSVTIKDSSAFYIMFSVNLQIYTTYDVIYIYYNVYIYIYTYHMQIIHTMSSSFSCLAKVMTDATGDVDMTPVVDDRKVGDPNPPEIKELLVNAHLDDLITLPKMYKIHKNQT